MAAEQQQVPHRHHVARQARPFAVQPPGAGQRHPAGAELLGAQHIERLGAAGEFGGLRGEPVAQHLVRSGVRTGLHRGLPSSGRVGRGRGRPVRTRAGPGSGLRVSPGRRRARRRCGRPPSLGQRHVRQTELACARQQFAQPAGLLPAVAHQLRQQRGDGQVLHVAGAEGAQHPGEVAGEVGGAVQPRSGQGLRGTGVVDEAVHALAQRDGGDEPVEEGGLAADDVDVGALQPLGQHRGLCLGELPLGVQSGQPHLLVGLQTQAVLLVGAGRLVQRRHRRRLLRQARGLGLELLADRGGLRLRAGAGAVGLGAQPGRDGLGLRPAGLLDDLGLLVAHLDLGEPGCGVLGLHPLGQPRLGLGVQVGGLEPGLGEGEFLGGPVGGGLLGGLGRLDVLDQLLLRLGLGRDDEGLPVALGLLDRAQLLDGLLLLGDGPVDGDAFADHLGDVPALRLAPRPPSPPRCGSARSPGRGR